MDIKKIIAGTTAVAVVATQVLSGVAFAAGTTTANPVWTDAVQFMKTQNLSSVANSVNEYAPLGTVTRGQAAKFFVAFAKNEFGIKPNTTKVCNFSDISKANSVFVPYIIESCQMGILHGVNGKYLPKANLTKLQFLTVLARIVKNNPSIQPVDAFNVLKSEGITKAPSLSSTVRPVSRIELAMLFQRSVAKYVKPATTTTTTTNSNSNANISSILGSILGNDNTTASATSTTTASKTAASKTTTPASTTTASKTATTPAVANQLVVALDPATPKGLTVPYNTYHQNVMTFDLTAGNKDVNIKSLTLLRKGVGKAEDFDKLGLYVNGRRISDWRTVSSYNDTLFFPNMNVVVKANTTLKVELIADFAKAAANHQDYFVIKSVDASSSVEWLPVQGNVTDILNVNTRVATYNLLSLPTKIARIGDDVVMARLRLVAPNSDAVSLKTITFVNNGSINADNLNNFSLYINGEKVWSANKMYSVRGDDLVTVELNKPYRIAKGASKIIELKGELIGGRSSDTIRFDLDDMMLTNLTYGVGNAYVDGKTNNISNDAKEVDTTIVVRAAKLVIDSIPLVNLYPNLKVQIGANGIVLGKFDMSVSSAVDVKGLRVNFELTSGSTNYVKTFDSSKPYTTGGITVYGGSNKFDTIYFDNTNYFAFTYSGSNAIKVVFTGDDTNYTKDFTWGNELSEVRYDTATNNYYLSWTFWASNGVQLYDPVVSALITDGTGANAHLYYAQVHARGNANIVYTLDRSVLVKTNSSSQPPAWCKDNVAALTNIRLIDANTKQVYLSTNINCQNLNNNYWVYTTDFSDAVFHLAKGKHTLEIVANIPVARNGLDAKGLITTLEHPRFWTYVRDDITWKKFNTADKSEVIPWSNITFNTLTLAIPYIYVWPRAFAKSALIAGKTNYTIASYILSISNIGKIKLYSPQFKIYSSTTGTGLDASFTKDVISNVSLYVNGKKVAEDAPDSNWLVHFDGAFANLDSTKQDASTAKISLKADITSDVKQVKKLKGLVVAVNMLESDDNYGNAFVFSTTKKEDLSYKRGGSKTSVLLSGVNTLAQAQALGIPTITSSDIKAAGNLDMSVDTTDSAYTYKFLVADGKTDNKIMDLSLAANYEDFTVNDIKGSITTGNGLSKVVDHVALLDNGTVEAVAYVRSDWTFEFNNLNYLVKEGTTKNLVVAVVIQNGQSAKVSNKYWTITILNVKGIGNSTSTVTPNLKNHYTSSNYTTAVWFPSAVAFTDTKYQGKTLAKFTVTNGGARTIILTDVNFAISNYVGFTSGDTLSGVHLELNDGTVVSNYTHTLTYTTGNVFTGDTSGVFSNGVFNFTTTTTTLKLKPGETKTFVVKVTNASIKWLSENSVDKVTFVATFNKSNGITFQDGDNNDAYRVSGLQGINISQSEISSTITLK